MLRLKDRKLERKLRRIDPDFLKLLNGSAEEFDDYYKYIAVGFGELIQLERGDEKYMVRRFFMHLTKDDLKEVNDANAA